MRVLHPWRLGLTLVAVILAGLVVWTGWQVWQVTSALSAATSDADELRAAVEAGDDASSDAALRSLQAHAGDASDRTRSATWSALSRLPGVGDDAAGVRSVAGVIDDLSHDGLVPLLRTADDLDTLLPRDGRVSIGAIEALQSTVAAGNDSLARADTQLQAADPRNFVGPLRTRYRELAAQVADASDALSSADTALRVLPTMLGRDEPRKYLLVFQNNAEVRATGGLPGSVSLVDVADGRIELDRQVTGSSFPRRQGSILPLTATERELFGTQMGEFFIDANFTPDFRRAADLMRARWQERFPLERIDGIIALDPVVLSYVMEAIGPVEVGPVELTQDNLVDEVLSGVYRRFAEPAQQDVFFEATAAAVFDRVASGVGSPRSLVQGLVRGAAEGRILVRSFRREEDAVLRPRQVSGELTSDGGEPADVAVTFNDSTGAKMSYYLRTTTRMVSSYCQDGTQSLSGRLTLTSTAPADAAVRLPDYVTGGGGYGVAPGDQIVTVQIFSTVGGEFVESRINAEPADPDVVRFAGRDVATFYVALSPQGTTDIEWRLTTGPGQTGPVDLRVTPGVVPGRDGGVVETACR